MKRGEENLSIDAKSKPRRRRRRWLWVLATILIITSGAAFLFFTVNGHHEEKIFELGDQYRISRMYENNSYEKYYHVASPDGEHYAIMLEDDDGLSYLLADGILKKASLSNPYPQFSADSQHLAYGLFNREQFSTSIVIDDKIYQPYGPHPQKFTLSPDGKQFAYCIEQNSQWNIILNGNIAGQSLLYPDFSFSPDGKRFAFLKQDENTSTVVVDGKETWDDRVWGLTFAGNSSELIYFITEDDGKKYLLYESGRKIPLLGKAIWNEIKFSKDGRHFAYITEREGWSGVIWDGREGPKINPPQYIWYLKISSNGEHISYSQIDTGHPIPPFVIDDKIITKYEYAANTTFSPDGKHVAFRTWRDEKGFVVLDDVEGPKYNSIDMIAFSPDSQHIAYSVEYDGPDSIKKAKQYLKEHLKKDWKIFETKQQIHVAYDGKIGPGYSWVSHPAFRADGTLVYYAVRDKTLYRVTKKN